MAMPADVPGSVALNRIADAASLKGRYARAAEKYGDAAAAAAQELAAEDCLVVAFLRTKQAESLIALSMVPTLPAAEAAAARQTVLYVLLPQFVPTVTRRKAAGTLLPGRCRAGEVAWFRAATERKILDQGVMPVEAAQAAKALAPTYGLETYLSAASNTMNALILPDLFGMSREMQLSHAAFVASALELMAQPRELPSIIYTKLDGVYQKALCSAAEQMLAHNARWLLPHALEISEVEEAAFVLMINAQRRFESSGAAAMRNLGAGAHDPRSSLGASLDAGEAEAAARGLRTGSLASCGSKEAHVSHFKLCGACHAVAYCCREHQLADWPAHKAACKAARKAAAAAPSSK